MPHEVRMFSRLMWFVIVFETIRVFVTIERSPLGFASHDIGSFLFNSFLTLGVLALLTWLAASMAQSWARWVLLILIVIGGIVLIARAGTFAQATGFDIFALIFGSICQIAAIIFVFSSGAAEWYRR